ncbi:MAG: hypothetical protein AB2993_07725 (plasmid) [Candidatus Symbiodolus clandestinus]
MFESEKSLNKLPPGFEKIESVVLPKEQVAIVKEWAKKAKAIAAGYTEEELSLPGNKG